MKPLYILFCLAGLLSQQSFAQVGRHEQPLDTVPIGGKEQEIKMEKMQGQDEVTLELKSLRDSVNTFLSNISKNNSASSNKSSVEDLKSSKAKLNKIISELETSEKNEALLKESYLLLEQTRKTLKALPR